MARNLIHVRGVELCVETLGSPADPAILLVMGSGGSMDWWEDEFCERLAAGSRLVVRYDHRDTGESVCYSPGEPGYGGDDLVADAAGVIDALGVSPAHVVGISMGGALSQLLALDYGDRVGSLTLIATTAGAGDPDLPGMSEADQARFAAVAEPDWSDRAAVIEYLVRYSEAGAGRSRPFDEEAARRLVGRVIDRSVSIESMTNHDILEGGERWRERLGDVRAPTLVVHGTEDPLFPVEHGAALAREIPGGRLLAVEGMGHELPRHVWDVVVPAVLAHTAGG